VFFSVVIPTYNRLPILQKCLRALEQQDYDSGLIDGYEIVVVDDGSTDDTIGWIEQQKDHFPHVSLFLQNHQGAAIARNLGIEKAQGDTIIFIDSDIVVTPSFLNAHAQSLIKSQEKLGHDRTFTYGAVINTANFDNPTSEPYKLLTTPPLILRRATWRSPKNG